MYRVWFSLGAICGFVAFIMFVKETRIDKPQLPKIEGPMTSIQRQADVSQQIPRVPTKPGSIVYQKPREEPQVAAPTPVQAIAPALETTEVRKPSSSGIFTESQYGHVEFTELPLFHNLPTEL